MTKKYLYGGFLGLAVALILNCRDTSGTPASDQTQAPMPADTARSGIILQNFKDTIGEKAVQPYVLKNSSGIEAVFTNYGQRLVSLLVPDREGAFEDIVLGYDSLAPYTRNRGGFFGATVGRYGNRIGGAQFTLDGTTYTLAANNGKNHLHGGEKGFDAVVWEVDSVAGNFISFHRISPDMEEGYPGNLEIWVRYTLTDANELVIDYEAITDKKTHVNLTNHSYFNLMGAGAGDVGSHIMQINADSMIPVDQELIPTGEIQAVAGTPFDFRDPKRIDRDIDAKDEQLEFGMGYDHTFVLNDTPQKEDGLVFAARVLEPQSGRVLEVYTTEPGVQFYGGNFLSGETGKKGKAYEKRGAFCLETHHYPNSPNESSFPSTMLAPGETYRTSTIYAFGVQP